MKSFCLAIAVISTMLIVSFGVTQQCVQEVNMRLDSVLADRDDSQVYPLLQTVSVRVDVGGCGTGVLVTRRVGDVMRTYVWTAGHVVKDCRNPTIYQEIRENGKFVGTVKTEAKVIAYSDPETGEDLALLEVLEDNFSTASATFTFDLQPIGTELIHVGCTLGEFNSTSLGIVSQTDRDLLETGRMFDQTSCMGYPGSSGGGVYLRDGRCIGLLVRGGGPGLNFIVPARRMLEWAQKMEIEWALDPDVEMPTKVVRVETPIEEQL